MAKSFWEECAERLKVLPESEGLIGLSFGEAVLERHIGSISSTEKIVSLTKRAFDHDLILAPAAHREYRVKYIASFGTRARKSILLLNSRAELARRCLRGTLASKFESAIEQLNGSGAYVCDGSDFMETYQMITKNSVTNVREAVEDIFVKRNPWGIPVIGVVTAHPSSVVDCRVRLFLDINEVYPLNSLEDIRSEMTRRRNLTLNDVKMAELIAPELGKDAGNEKPLLNYWDNLLLENEWTCSALATQSHTYIHLSQGLSSEETDIIHKRIRERNEEPVLYANLIQELKAKYDEAEEED